MIDSGNGLMSLLQPYYNAITGTPMVDPGDDSDKYAELLRELQARKAIGTSAAGNYSSDGNRWEQLAAKRAANRYGWGPQDFRFIDWIISGGGPQDVVAESHWNPNAVNPSSGAYGIPQILPQAHPGDLGLAPGQQVNWLLNYIKQRYGDPQSAYQHKASSGWY